MVVFEELLFAVPSLSNLGRLTDYSCDVAAERKPFFIQGKVGMFGVRMSHSYSELVSPFGVSSSLPW